VDAALAARAAGESVDPATVAAFLDAVRAALAAVRPPGGLE